MKKIIICILAALMLFSLFGCGTQSGEQGDVIPVKLLTTGWTNTPTDEDDPYRKWIRDNYKLDVDLQATADFGSAAYIAFADTQKPDIVSLPDLSQLKNFRQQGVLLDDWTPYLDKMPNVKAFMERDDQQLLKGLFTEDGKITAIWTNPNAVTWSLKIREDWAEEYRQETQPGPDNYYPAGATASTDPETGESVPWYPYTSDDLLNFARWIKVTKNADPKNLDYFGFSTCGGDGGLGIMESWLPLMWGYNYMPPHGFYVDETTNRANFGVLDGSFECTLGYLKTMVDEELIDPNWETQKQANDVRTKGGKIGITWYPGMVNEMTANYTGQNTDDWWEVYDVPMGIGADEDGPTDPGMMINDSLASHIITVSKQAALNTEKMDRICKLLNDLVSYVDNTKQGAEKYVRGSAYDALRWGVGVDADSAFQSVEGTDILYVCVKTGNTYRESQAGVGAWDWGAWFSSTNDGVVSGEGKTISNIVKKQVDFDARSAQYEYKTQVGSFLTLDQSVVQTMLRETRAYMFNYAKSRTNETIEEFKARWKTQLGGDKLLQDATQQFTELGFIK